MVRVPTTKRFCNTYNLQKLVARSKCFGRWWSTSLSSPSVKPLACPHGYGLKTSLSDVCSFHKLLLWWPKELARNFTNQECVGDDEAFESNGLFEKEHNTCVFGYQEHLEERRRKRLSLHFSLNCWYQLLSLVSHKWTNALSSLYKLH